jgi:hypothetical protein
MTDAPVECALSFAPNSDINGSMMCTNCVQMKRQLDDALLQLKSLQKIIELLQQDNRDSKVVNREGTADKGAILNYKEVKAACSNSSFSISNKPCKSDLDIVISDKVDLDSPAIDSKTIVQADSPIKWSDVVAGRKRFNHRSASQVKSAPLYNIPTIINGQVLPMDKLAPKQMIMKPVMNTNARNV